NPWYFFADACLTASTAAGVQPSGSGNGRLPGCVAIQSTYSENLVGGQNGVAGPTQTLPDPNGQGALRFTNGNPGGYAQHGNIAWSWLNANYPQYYPSSFSTSDQQAAVQATCQSGLVWDLSHHGKAVKVTGDTIPLYDYAPIPNAYVELPSTMQIANEAAMARPQATPIFYQLRISQRGLLSLSYSVNGGAYQQVIKGQDITAANGPL